MANNMRPDLETIGRNIAKFRKGKGYTQKKLGELLGIQDKTISKWEKGVVGPDITILRDIAYVLDVSVEDILCGVKTKNVLKKDVLVLSAVVFLLVIIATIHFVYSNYYGWNVYDFKSNNENFHINGYIVSNKDESIIVLERFNSHTYLSTLKNVDYIEMKFYIDGEVVYRYEHKDDEKLIAHFISNTNQIVFSVDKEFEIDENDYIIIYYKIDNKTFNETITFEM